MLSCKKKERNRREKEGKGKRKLYRGTEQSHFIICSFRFISLHFDTPYVETNVETFCDILEFLVQNSNSTYLSVRLETDYLSVSSGSYELSVDRDVLSVSHNRKDLSVFILYDRDRRSVCCTPHAHIIHFTVL